MDNLARHVEKVHALVGLDSRQIIVGGRGGLSGQCLAIAKIAFILVGCGRRRFEATDGTNVIDDVVVPVLDLTNCGSS
jgi:hypothetical protein